MQGQPGRPDDVALKRKSRCQADGGQSGTAAQCRVKPQRQSRWSRANFDAGGLAVGRVRRMGFSQPVDDHTATPASPGAATADADRMPAASGQVWPWARRHVVGMKRSLSTAGASAPVPVASQADLVDRMMAEPLVERHKRIAAGERRVEAAMAGSGLVEFDAVAR